MADLSMQAFADGEQVAVDRYGQTVDEAAAQVLRLLAEAGRAPERITVQAVYEDPDDDDEPVAVDQIVLAAARRNGALARADTAGSDPRVDAVWRSAGIGG